MLTSYSNECASMLSSMMIVQGDLPQLESEFSTNQQAVDEKEATFEAKLDGGDTEGLIAEIQATAIAEAGRLQSRLLDLAPWVSAEALTALFERPGLLPEAALTDILKANPDALSYRPLVDKAREQLPAEKVDEALVIQQPQEVEKPVKAIPNPAAGNVLFLYQLPADSGGETALEIIDINGRLIRRIPLSSQNGSVEWNSGVVEPGIYLYRWVREGQVMMTDRLVITR